MLRDGSDTMTNVWLIEPKDKLYQWIEKLPLEALVRLEVLLIIEDIIADKSLNKQRKSLLELAI